MAVTAHPAAGAALEEAVPFPRLGSSQTLPAHGWAVRACAHRHAGPRVPQLEESNPQAGDGGRIWMR